MIPSLTPERLAVLASAWLAGTTAAVWLVPVDHPALAVAAALAGAFLAAHLARRAWPLVIALAVAWTSAQLDFDGSQRLAPMLVGRDLALRGWVDGFPSFADGQVTFSLQTEGERQGAELPERVRLTWYDPPIEIQPSMALALTVRLKSPRGLVNPGGFDYERWLFTENIGATGYVRSGEATTADWTLSRRWLAFRAALVARIAELATSRDARALLVALAAGERYELDDAHWRVLRETGTSHLVAISGLHVGIIATWLFFLVRRLWLRLPTALALHDLEAASIVSLVGATIYAAIAGFTVPTQRALIMLAIALALVVMRRSPASLSGMSIALILVTLLDPLAVLSGAFWLSFGAVGILCVLTHQRRAVGSRLTAFTKNALEAVRTQWGITLGLAPIVAFTFGELSYVAPAVNLIAIPFFALLLVPLVLVATFSLAIGSSGAWLVWLASLLAETIYSVLDWVVQSGLGSYPVPGPALVSTLLMIAGVVIALPAQPLPGRCLGLIAIAAALLHPPARPAAGALRATVLDVGHGLAVLVLTAEHALLYDTGARFRSGFDTGRNIVLPALRRLGVSRLDRIVVSHADNDHAGGLDALLAAFPSAGLLAGRGVRPERATRCVSGQRWQWDGVGFEVLHPSRDAVLDGNDGSCVLRIDTRDGSILLTGDIETRGELSLLGSAARLTADVVIVPHHGSATSSSEPFVDAVDASFAVVSASFDNRWGFPRPEIVARWQRAGAKLVTTGSDGAIDVELGTGEIAVRGRRWRRQRPWMASTNGTRPP